MTTAIETTIAAKTEHQIPGALLQKKVQVTIVGLRWNGEALLPPDSISAPGNGCFRASTRLDVTLVDGDRIPAPTVVRQPFSESEIGLHKATVLATRINLFWGLGWKECRASVDESWGTRPTF